MTASAASYLAENVRSLREQRGLTQQQISKIAGVPRATWGNLESGAANPTLQVLTRVAAALQVRLEELLSAPRTGARHVPARELFVRRRGEVQIRRLLPEALPGLEIERMTFPAKATMVGVPHTPGTREYLTVEQGALELRVGGESYRLAEGDVVMFRGDQKHAYANVHARTSIAYSVIAFAPSGS
ncbi:MAG: DNA-binding protein [Myxococcaceae bacterium]|nr:DNA-binding protein [Myxococcaceae bacterium]